MGSRWTIDMLCAVCPHRWSVSAEDPDKGRAAVERAAYEDGAIRVELSHAPVMGHAWICQPCWSAIDAAGREVARG